ncbi:MAG TPA: hypothetical protein VGQ03_04140 [Nitrososphaera sp.]|nr:hypothetical protein [Nitrososphaera sp.]
MKKDGGISDKTPETKIIVSKDGPYLVSGDIPLPFRSSRPIKKVFLGIGSRAKNLPQDWNMHYAGADAQRTSLSVMALIRRLDSMDERLQLGHPMQDRLRNLTDQRLF